MTSSSWRHSPHLSIKPGKVGSLYRISCRCGWQIGWLPDREQAQRLYDEHTGVKEKPRAP